MQTCLEKTFKNSSNRTVIPRNDLHIETDQGNITGRMIANCPCLCVVNMEKIVGFHNVFQLK